MDSFLGLEPSLGRIQRIAMVAFVFVAAALYRGYQNGVLHSPQNTTALPLDGGNITRYGDNNTNYEPSSFCFTKGSLHQLALDMFNHSSPPGSMSYKKLKRVLDASSDFYIDMGGGNGE